MELYEKELRKLTHLYLQKEISDIIWWFLSETLYSTIYDLLYKKNKQLAKEFYEKSLIIWRKYVNRKKEA